MGWKAWADRRTEADKIEEAKQEKGNWGYRPRYEPTYVHSMKAKKYANQTKSERVRDTPRLSTSSQRDERVGFEKPEKVQSLLWFAREHNRTPGVFDYDFPQDFYSIHPEIDFDAYYVIGGDNHMKLTEPKHV